MYRCSVIALGPRMSSVIISLWMPYHDLWLNSRSILPNSNTFSSFFPFPLPSRSSWHCFAPPPAHIYVPSDPHCSGWGLNSESLQWKLWSPTHVGTLIPTGLLCTFKFASPFDWLLLYLPSSGRLGNYNLIWRSHCDHVHDTHVRVGSVLEAAECQ